MTADASVFFAHVGRFIPHFFRAACFNAHVHCSTSVIMVEIFTILRLVEILKTQITTYMLTIDPTQPKKHVTQFSGGKKHDITCLTSPCSPYLPQKKNAVPNAPPGGSV